MRGMALGYRFQAQGSESTFEEISAMRALLNSAKEKHEDKDKVLREILQISQRATRGQLRDEARLARKGLVRPYPLKGDSSLSESPSPTSRCLACYFSPCRCKPR